MITKHIYDFFINRIEIYSFKYKNILIHIKLNLNYPKNIFMIENNVIHFITSCFSEAFTKQIYPFFKKKFFF